MVHIRHEPEVMTGRARVYLVIAALRHMLIGLCCVLVPETFQSSSFDPLRAILPLRVWGFAFLAAAFVCTVAAIRRSEHLARLGLIMSGTTSAVWATGFLLAWVSGDLSSPTGPIIWWAVTLKDFVVCSQPMRSPFEPLVRAVRAERAAPRVPS